MSLIDEALKRARMEAAQRAAEGEGLPYPTIPRHLGRRRRRAWLLPAVVVMAVVAGLGIGWWFASSRPRGESVAALGGGVSGTGAEPVTSGPAGPEAVVRDPRPAAPQIPNVAVPEPSAGGRPAPPEARLPAAEPPPVDRPEPPPAAAASNAQPPASTPTAPPAGEPPPSRPRSLPETREAPGPAGPPAAITDPDSGVLLELPDRQSPATPEADDSAADGAAELVVESHAQQYPLPGGGAIELAGIAWSETGPFALINGRVVSPGATIEGYTLERIRPGHVILAGAGRRIQLNLR